MMIKVNVETVNHDKLDLLQFALSPYKEQGIHNNCLALAGHNSTQVQKRNWQTWAWALLQGQYKSNASK